MKAKPDKLGEALKLEHMKFRQACDEMISESGRELAQMLEEMNVSGNTFSSRGYLALVGIMEHHVSVKPPQFGADQIVSFKSFPNIRNRAFPSSSTPKLAPAAPFLSSSSSPAPRFPVRVIKMLELSRIFQRPEG